MDLQQPEILNPKSRAPVVLLCDHASNHVPDDLHDLRVPRHVLDDHMGWDIGAGALTRRIAGLMDIPAVLATHSRLVLDTNRELDHPTLIPEVSDGVIIPGNQGLDAAARQARIDRFHTPFHDACTSLVQGYLADGIRPIVVAVHSYTPEMNGQKRPWDAGLMWQHDDRLSQALIGLFERETDLVVDGQVPYSGKQLFYTPGRHAQAHGFAASTLEIRNDHLQDDHHIDAWARLLADMLDELAARSDL